MQTCWQAVHDKFCDAGNVIVGYPEGVAKPRIFVHDLIHLITNESAFTALGEQRTAIIQSVLTRDVHTSHCTTYHSIFEKEAIPIPSFSAICAHTLPGVCNHIIGVHNTIGLSGKFPKLTPQEALEIYQFAKILDRTIKTATGWHFYEMPFQALADMPISIFEEAVKNAQCTFGRFNSQTSTCAHL